MKQGFLAAVTPRRGLFCNHNIVILALCFCFSAVTCFAQPAPSAPRSGTVPAVAEKRLANGLTIAVIERRNVPLVTVQLLVKGGASFEDISKAGLADLTASMLTKGTKSRTATQIAEQMEFLGGTINTGAGWNNSIITITVTSDKLDKAMAIMADVALNPAFDQKEIDLLKSQALDGLKYNLTQPGFLATYVASKYSFGEHPAGGTPTSINAVTRGDIINFHQNRFSPSESVLIYAGDVTVVQAEKLSKSFFGTWNETKKEIKGNAARLGENGKLETKNTDLVRRILVIDLPNSGQASVSYQRRIDSIGRRDSSFYPASTLNSLLGGGYSSRLNQEIRIKRGLSYGAGSGFGWRSAKTNFSTRTQTKNESAAEVAELVLAEIKRLTEGQIANVELTPRKSVLTGNFGRNLETTGGLAGAVGDLYSYGIPPSELNAYVGNVNSVTEAQIREFAAANLLGGDIIIVGDYSVFKDDLVKRFPNLTVAVIKAAELDISKDNLL